MSDIVTRGPLDADWKQRRDASIRRSINITRKAELPCCCVGMAVCVACLARRRRLRAAAALYRRNAGGRL